MSCIESLILKKMLVNQILRTVCSGGGAKGIGYPGCYTAMEETGLLKGINEFSGTSAGVSPIACLINE